MNSDKKLLKRDYNWDLIEYSLPKSLDEEDLGGRNWNWVDKGPVTALSRKLMGNPNGWV